jgi:hypothetical protein
MEDEALEEQEIPELEGTRTRSGGNIKMPDRLIAEMNAAANNYEIRLTPAEESYYAAMKELREFGLIDWSWHWWWILEFIQTTRHEV